MKKVKGIRIIEEASDEIKSEAKSICEDFKDYIYGIRVMILMQRSKDVESHGSRNKKVIITNGPTEFYEALVNLLFLKYSSDTDSLRIYSSVNPRNINKAIYNFKLNMLDADHSSKSLVKMQFYFDIKSKFVSSLMKPSSADKSLFLFDVDRVEDFDRVIGCLSEISTIEKQYKTKNGWHIITQPFNYTQDLELQSLMVQERVEFKKDSLLLLKY